MNHKIRPPGGGGGGDPGEGVGEGIVAGLGGAIAGLDPAAGVADHDDPADVGGGKGKPSSGEDDPLHPTLKIKFAYGEGKVRRLGLIGRRRRWAQGQERRRGAERQGAPDAVDPGRGAGLRTGQGSNDRATVSAEENVGRNRRLGHGRNPEGQDQETSEGPGEAGEEPFDAGAALLRKGKDGVQSDHSPPSAPGRCWGLRLAQGRRLDETSSRVS